MQSVSPKRSTYNYYCLLCCSHPDQPIWGLLSVSLSFCVISHHHPQSHAIVEFEQELQANESLDWGQAKSLLNTVYIVALSLFRSSLSYCITIDPIVSFCFKCVLNKCPSLPKSLSLSCLSSLSFFLIPLLSKTNQPYRIIRYARQIMCPYSIF